MSAERQLFQLGDEAWIADGAGGDVESIQVVACDGKTVCVAFSDGTVGFRPLNRVFGTEEDAKRARRKSHEAI